jgi:hypothetical protein
MKVLEEMKAKADNANTEHETERKKLVEELDTLRQSKVVVYFICSAYVS